MSLQPKSHLATGAVALVGSGEYLDFMNTTDAYLLETLGGASNARVALLPTASGLEADGPTTWNRLGVSHFEKLGVKDIRATTIIDRASASDPEQLALLADANCYYFSGGNPQHIIESLRGSPSWKRIIEAHAQGGVLAGCSAGAMALSAYTIALRQMMAGGRPAWVNSLALLPHIVVFPHFDRMANFIDQVVFQQLLSTLPDEIVALGIDENTALVRTRIETTDTSSSSARWQVMGLQTVKVFEKGMPQRTLHVGEELIL